MTQTYGKCEQCRRYEQIRYKGGYKWYDYCRQRGMLVPCDGNGTFIDEAVGEIQCRRLYKPINDKDNGESK